MKVIIIGGGAGGASAAARLRRLDENAEIIIIEKGQYVSSASCGLPYFIGGEIENKKDLTVQTPKSLRNRLNLDVRINQEAIEIIPSEKQVVIRDLSDNSTYNESYDKLVLSTGAEPVRPDFPGADNTKVFTLRTISDTYEIHDFININSPKSALVVGGGYIGLEMAENLVNIGLKVTVAEFSDHVIGSLDFDMAAEVHDYIREQGIELLLKNGVVSIKEESDSLLVQLQQGEILTDMVLLSVGVKPDTKLASEAGLEINSRGAIIVDNHMCTSNPDIYAVGDSIEVIQLVNNKKSYIPLAGPANKQGRLAADNIAGIRREYKGSQGTAILKLFDMTVGTTGLNEATAADSGEDFDKVYLLTSSHAGYYPGAKPLSIKVFFQKTTGKILGAQLIGYDGVDKRLDIFATAIRHEMEATDLAELELSYAPPYSSAKDPVNMIGFMMQNLNEEMVNQYHWKDVEKIIKDGNQMVDVRTISEYASGHIEGALNIPVDDLRKRLDELDKSKPVYLYCRSGQRSYYAARILKENGFDVSHLAGGYVLYSSVMTEKNRFSSNVTMSQKELLK